MPASGDTHLFDGRSCIEGCRSSMCRQRRLKPHLNLPPRLQSPCRNVFALASIVDELVNIRFSVSNGV